MEIITSAANGYVKEVARLADAKYRRQTKRFVMEGSVMIFGAIEAGLVPDSIAVSESYAGEIPACIRTVRVADGVFRKMCDTVSPQGILGVFPIPEYEPCAPSGNCLVLDHVRDPGNLGTIIRTAAACGWRELYLVDCVDVYNPKTVRATMTGLFYVRCYDCTEKEIESLVCSESVLTVADMHGENLFESKPIDRPTALVIGNEAHGVSGTFFRMAERTLSLPMQDVESLNAAVSASVIMYHLTYQK